MAERTARRVRLDTPAVQRRGVPRPHYDPDAFGRLSERIARFLGTARFIVYMTAFCAVWLLWNTLAPPDLQFDPRALNYTLLTLMLSLQASYAAPLILLAQNRQADRDKVALEEDRATSARLQSDVEYLSREVASLRHALGEVATRDYLRDQLREVADEVVTRVSGSEEDEAERQARVEREERERRAERKKRRAEQRAEHERSDERPDIGEPFVGEPDEH